MGEAYFDSKPIGLWNFREIEGDCKGCTVRLVKRRALLTSVWPVHHKSFNFIVQCFIIMWMISKKFQHILIKERQVIFEELMMVCCVCAFLRIYQRKITYVEKLHEFKNPQNI